VQIYLMWTGVVVAYIFTSITEWTTWVLLVAMALYDLFAVLTPHGPLQMLVNLAIERDQEIPALVYEAREVRRPRHRQAPAQRAPADPGGESAGEVPVGGEGGSMRRVASSATNGRVAGPLGEASEGPGEDGSPRDARGMRLRVDARDGRHRWQVRSLRVHRSAHLITTAQLLMTLAGRVPRCACCRDTALLLSPSQACYRVMLLGAWPAGIPLQYVAASVYNLCACGISCVICLSVDVIKVDSGSSALFPCSLLWMHFVAATRVALPPRRV
jgi:hypothetical protein